MKKLSYYVNYQKISKYVMFIVLECFTYAYYLVIK